MLRHEDTETIRHEALFRLSHITGVQAVLARRAGERRAYWRNLTGLGLPETRGKGGVVRPQGLAHPSGPSRGTGA